MRKSAIGVVSKPERQQQPNLITSSVLAATGVAAAFHSVARRDAPSGRSLNWHGARGTRSSLGLGPGWCPIVSVRESRMPSNLARDMSGKHTRRLAKWLLCT